MSVHDDKFSASKTLVLASTSPYRRQLLERLGLPFRCLAPVCDESAFKRDETDPRRLAERLAAAKAASLAPEYPGATIIGCDQVVAFQGQIFGKPGTANRAIDQLAAMAGQTHELFTAVIVIEGTRRLCHTDVTRLRLRALSRLAIERYVAADQPLDCAGSYKIESRGIALFDRIETDDHTAIIGLPLIALTTILGELGFPVP